MLWIFAFVNIDRNLLSLKGLDGVDILKCFLVRFGAIRSLQVAMQMEKVDKKAYGMLAFIGRGIEFKNCNHVAAL